MNRRSFFAAIAGAPVAVAGIAAAKPTKAVARGGVIYAPMRPYLTGEAGYELVMPLRLKGPGVLGVVVAHDSAERAGIVTRQS